MRIVALLGEAPALRLAGALEAAGQRSLGHDAGEVAGIGRVGVPISADAKAALTRDRMLVEFAVPEASVEHLRLVADAGGAQ